MLSLISMLVAIAIIFTVIWAAWTFIPCPAQLMPVKGLVLFLVLMVFLYWAWQRFGAGFAGGLR